MSAESAKAWSETLESVDIGGGDAQELNARLQEMLAGQSEENIEAIMSQIGSMDITSIDAWEDLRYTFDELKIAIPTAELDAFIETGIEASHAIKKIDFLGLNNALQDTYEIIEKIKEGSGRIFS
jgi:hypothetical protein